MIAVIVSFALLAAVAAQDATTAAATTAAGGSTAAPKCSQEEITKLAMEQQKCIEEKGFMKCMTDAGDDKAKMCACFEKVLSCGKAVKDCLGTLTPEQEKVALEGCVKTSGCTEAQCKDMLAASSTLVASLPVMVLSALAAFRLL